MQQIYNILIATILSFLIILGWNMMFEQPVAQKQVIKKVIQQENNNSPSIKQEKLVVDLETPQAYKIVKIDTAKLYGNIETKGLIIDDLFLKNYLVEDYKHHVHLLSAPSPNKKNSYFIDFGWASTHSMKMPSLNTIWKADRATLEIGQPVTFSWDNGDNIIFRIRINIDENYMFSIEKFVENNSINDINIGTYTTINRNFNTLEKSQLITHEGPIGVIKDKLVEISYKEVSKRDKKFTIEEGKRDIKNAEKNNKGWFGFADKYWVVALIFPKTEEDKLYIKHKLDSNKDHNFKITNAANYKIIKAGEDFNQTSYIFAGPKELKLLDSYEKNLHVALFDRAVDFGILYFITKPIFILLEIFYSWVGNFGLAIILLTLFIRVLMSPLSLKACVSMIKMKALQPEVLKLKTLYKDDKAKLNKESMALFKKGNVHPMSGCLPIILQVPVFFALYKVLYITIEMRQAPFFGWIKDLSIPDPSNVFTLFGLLNWHPPALLNIGILPLLLGLTMVIQQKLTPTTYEDKVQATMIKLMPYIFIVLFASFPSGLVIYWICTNIISILQQIIVKKYLEYKANNKEKKSSAKVRT